MEVREATGNAPMAALVRPASMTLSRLISTAHAGNTGRLAITPAKSGKQIERCVISTFQVAESVGFKGDIRQWQDLLRVGD